MTSKDVMQTTTLKMCQSVDDIFCAGFRKHSTLVIMTKGDIPFILKRFLCLS